MKTPSRTTPFSTKNEAVAADESLGSRIATRAMKSMELARNAPPVAWKECGSLMRA